MRYYLFSLQTYDDILNYFRCINNNMAQCKSIAKQCVENLEDSMSLNFNVVRQPE